jgi:predicted MFS family arabinose efflux permease
MGKKSFLIFGLSFFTVSFGVAAMAALIPSIAEYFVVKQVYAARLVWLYMLPYGLFALVWPPLTRVVTLKKLFLSTAAGFCLSAFFFSAAGSVEQAFLFRFLMGVFGCSFVPLILIAVGKTVPKKKKAKYIGSFFGISYISTCVSVFLSRRWPWQWVYVVPALLSLAVIILAVKFLDQYDFRRAGLKVSYIRTFQEEKVKRFFLAVILGSFLYHGFQQWLGVYLKQTYSLAQVSISSIFTVATVSAAAFEFLGGFFCSRIGNITLARLGFILMGTFLGLFLTAGNYQKLYLFIVLWGAGWAFTHVGLCAHMAQFPDKILRDASGLNSALRFSSGGLGAFIGGAVISRVGFHTHFFIIALGVVLLGVYLNSLLEKTI